MKTKVVGAAAAGVGVVALLALAGQHSRRRPVPSEPAAEAHMWAVLSGEVPA
jgi:hypothetical protein